VDPSTVELPRGTLKAEGSRLTVRLRARGPVRRALRDWLDRLGSAHLRWLLPPSDVAGLADGLELSYREDGIVAASLPSLLGGFAADPPVALPRVLGMGRALLDAAAELLNHELQGALWAPAVTFASPSSATPWRFLALPAAGATLAEWAAADASSWSWTPPGALLGRDDDVLPFAFGAALHQALVGCVFPEALPARENFTRLLRGRVGLPARLESSVKGALPRSRAAEAEKLAALVLQCLSPEAGARPDPVALRERFAEIEQRLGRDQLIRCWEFENQPAYAARLAGQGQPAEPFEPPAAPPERRDWSDIAREKRDAGELNEALEASWNAIRLEGPWHVRAYLALVQRIASRLAPPRSALAAMIDRLPKSILGGLDEADFLREQHIRYRYLNARPADLVGLDRRYSSGWVEAVALAMRARILLQGNSSFNAASALCRSARALCEAMPEGGGEPGLYARAYVDLLDGIAHVGAIGQYRDLSFCADAFRLFTESFRRASQADADGLRREILRWLGWLANLTRGSDERSLAMIYAGIEGILRSLGLRVEELSSGEIPEIPWYDDDVLLPP
jgi:hypothetical protein